MLLNKNVFCFYSASIMGNNTVVTFLAFFFNKLGYYHPNLMRYFFVLLNGFSHFSHFDYFDYRIIKGQ